MKLFERTTTTDVTPLPERTADEMRELLSEERAKLTQLHKERDRVGNQIGDWLIEKQTGGQPSPGLLADAMTEQAQIDQQISHQAAIVERIESRLWEWQRSDEARQYAEDIEALTSMTKEGQRLAEAYDVAVLELVRIGKASYSLQQEWDRAKSRASTYWTKYGRDEEAPYFIRPITPYEVSYRYLINHRLYDINQLVTAKVKERR